MTPCKSTKHAIVDLSSERQWCARCGSVRAQDQGLWSAWTKPQLLIPRPRRTPLTMSRKLEVEFSKLKLNFNLVGKPKKILFILKPSCKKNRFLVPLEQIGGIVSLSEVTILNHYHKELATACKDLSIEYRDYPTGFCIPELIEIEHKSRKPISLVLTQHATQYGHQWKNIYRWINMQVPKIPVLSLRK